jgi:uncharacterized membrane protein
MVRFLIFEIMNTNKLATASFWLSIIGLFLWDILFTIISIIAVVLGIIALVQINKNKTKGKAKAIWGISLGLLGIMFGLFLGVKPESLTPLILPSHHQPPQHPR